MPSTITEQDRLILARYVTETDPAKSVFALRNLPQVVAGAVFSRYSRSDKDLRQILLDEFIKDRDSGFEAIAQYIQSTDEDPAIAIQAAEDFYDRVLVGYGDDSVAELGGAHLACEGISNLAAKFLEDSRLGISPLEKSTRYVSFSRKVDGRYQYYRDPSITMAGYRHAYERALDGLFDTYTELLEPMQEWIAKTYQSSLASAEASKRAQRAKALDLLRGLLPMATLTNVGLYGNGRAFEYLLLKLGATPFAETQALKVAIYRELNKVIPSFIKRLGTDRGGQMSEYLSDRRINIGEVARRHQIGLKSEDKESLIRQKTAVTLVQYDPNATVDVIAAILYPEANRSWEDVWRYAYNLSVEERRTILNAYLGDRKSRFDKPGRAFEQVYYTFDLLGDLGAYRDLHRHRVLTQERQHYTAEHGYEVPPQLLEANLDTPYRDAMDAAADTFDRISKELPLAAQYVVPFGYRIRWRIKMNLREVYHFAELRSGRQGHPSYRVMAQQMYELVRSVHPALAEGMSFVDMESYELERLAAEEKLAMRREQGQG